MRVVLSIGSNMDDREALLRSVVDEFSDEIVAASPIFATPPWGVTDQDEFLNAVLIVDVATPPAGDPREGVREACYAVLRRGQALEEAAERRRVRHWGPRTLDVDVVAAFVDSDGEIVEVSMDDAELTIPHPYARQRAFVLVPWLRADPRARLGGVDVATLIDALDPGEVAAVKEKGPLL